MQFKLLVFPCYYFYKLAVTFAKVYILSSLCLIRKEAFMPKQLSLSERIIIERMISKDYSFASIGRNLERSASTISREVIKYRCFVDRIPLPGENDCTHKNSCLKNSICDDVGVHGCYGYRCKRCPEDRICTNICASYESSQCPLLDKPPYV